MEQFWTRRLWAILPILMLSSMVVPGCRHGKTEPHSVTLNWQAPPAVPGTTIVGYNVYRRMENNPQFVKIATSVAGPPYEDRLVSSGKTYVYAVTSIDQAGRESRFSVVTKATIP